MGISGSWIQRQIAVGLLMLLVAPFGKAAVAPGRQTQDAPSAPSQQNARSTPANGTGAQAGNPPATTNNADLPAAPRAANNAQQQSAQPAQQQQNTQPVGTAAAPYEHPVGVAVSRPAGAAIAPAKQRRARSFFIRIGLVVGAAVAVGTVIALSKASPSRPSH